ncbi:hypothetical protein IWZ00DRAFT_488177 [Phyllosticta capitalensis]
MTSVDIDHIVTTYLYDVTPVRKAVHEALLARCPEYREMEKISRFDTSFRALTEMQRRERERNNATNPGNTGTVRVSRFSVTLRNAPQKKGGPVDSPQTPARPAPPGADTARDDIGELGLSDTRNPHLVEACRQQLLSSTSPEVQEAKQWLRIAMKDQEFWLFEAKFHTPEITFVDLKTGEVALSTKVDYDRASPSELWTKLYGGEPTDANAELYAAFEEKFREHHQGNKTTGMKPSKIREAMWERGFTLQSHRLLSFRSRSDMTVVIKILDRDDRIVSPRYQLEDLSRECFQPPAVHSLAQNVCGPEGSRLNAAHIRLFPEDAHAGLNQAELDAKEFRNVLVWWNQKVQK